MIEAMEPPTSLDVIERYGLEMLAAMRNGEQSNLMLKLIHGWRFNAPTLRFLFDRLFAVRRRHDELRATQGEMALSARLSPGTNRPILFATVSPGYFDSADEIAAHELGATTYAGTVVLVLAGLLQTFQDGIGASRDDWDRSEPLIGGRSIGAILDASANNFRHNEEWLKDRAHPMGRQLVSIQVLADAFGEQIAPDGANHSLCRNVCPETLQLLSDGSFDVLSEKFFAFANSMVKRRTG
jgi:hypothetical protein